MVENNKKHLKTNKKVFFFIVRTRDSRKAHARTRRKMQFLAFRSDSQTLVDTQKLVAPQQFHVNLVIFVREPLVSMIKNTDYEHEIIEEQPAFECQPAFGSHSETLKNCIFLHVLAWALLESLMCTIKKYFLNIFWVFFIVFEHENPCASMRSLVEIHNRDVFFCWLAT